MTLANIAVYLFFITLRVLELCCIEWLVLQSISMVMTFWEYSKDTVKSNKEERKVGFNA